MTTNQNVLVVLIDADDLRYSFPNWPDQVCLATCLLRSGDYHMIYFRRDERADIADRIIDTLQLEKSEICFVPEVSGFSTREFLYSDERRLMALIASDSNSLDGAVDYLVNYNYALEEDLDPIAILGLPPRRKVSIQPQEALETPEGRRLVSKQPRELSPLLPEFLRKAAEQSRRPCFASVRPRRQKLRTFDRGDLGQMADAH